MSPPDLNLLLAFDVLLEEANVTHAARRLGLSQPAMSARLARLRELFTDPLLVPSQDGRGMVPTARALALRAPLREALTRLWRVIEPPAAFEPRTSQRTFTLALNDNVATMLSGLLAAAVREAGGEHVRLAFVQPGADLAAKLEAGTLDLALGSSVSMSGPFQRRHLFDERYQTARRKGHPWSEPLDLEAFCSLHHVIVSSEGGGFAGLVDRELARLGRTRHVAVSLQSYAVVPTLLAQTDYLCTLPRRLLQRFADQLLLCEPPLALPTYSLSAFWHARDQEDPAHTWLRERLFALAAPPPLEEGHQGG
jgi:DNA-binding transcriptional LysR family regulator